MLLTDEEIAEVVRGDALQCAIVKLGMRRDGNDIELHGVVEVIARIIKG